MDGFSVEKDRSFIARVNSSEDLQQRTFAGAVASEQCMHLARKKLERHAIQNGGPSESLGDAVHAQKRSGFSRSGDGFVHAMRHIRKSAPGRSI